MKKKILLLLIVISMICSYSFIADAFEMITVSGTAQFKCRLLSKYMKKHGYSFIDEIIYGRKIKTNLFAAGNAEIVIKNKYDAVLASGSADSEGKFSFSVPKDNNYNIIVKFHNREIKDEVMLEESENYIADLGHFDSDTVDTWFPSRALSYCYSCNIRYLENKEASL